MYIVDVRKLSDLWSAALGEFQIQFCEKSRNTSRKKLLGKNCAYYIAQSQDSCRNNESNASTASLSCIACVQTLATGEERKERNYSVSCSFFLFSPPQWPKSARRLVLQGIGTVKIFGHIVFFPFWF